MLLFLVSSYTLCSSEFLWMQRMPTVACTDSKFQNPHKTKILNFKTERETTNNVQLTTYRARQKSKPYNLLLITVINGYRQDAAKRQTVGIKFTHRPKIRFFAPQGRLVAPIHVKLGTADGHVGPLSRTKFQLNRRRGWACGPKIWNFPIFGKESPRRANPLTDF